MNTGRSSLAPGVVLLRKLIENEYELSLGVLFISHDDRCTIYDNDWRYCMQ